MYAGTIVKWSAYLISFFFSDGEVEVLEDIPEVAKSYKLGDGIEFTATFKAIFDPEQVRSKEEKVAPAGESVIDVEVESKKEEVAPAGESKEEEVAPAAASVIDVEVEESA
jgi:hypothetical protein